MRLGISLYPDHSTFEEDQAYIDLASQYGFQRIFSCLISAEDSKEEIEKRFRKMNDYAHSKGMEIIYDVSPAVFDKLGIHYDDLSFFHDIHADGIRLDEGFDGLKEALMTYNPYGLKIEINASSGFRTLDHILSCHPKKGMLTACHNFYPQRYTGLGYNRFIEATKAVYNTHIPLAAFVGSSNPQAFGPWPGSDGLVTLESHRGLPIDVQARQLFATGMIDDVIIANCYAAKDELEALSRLDPGVLSFKIEPEGQMSETEGQIVFDHPHFARGDMSEFMARSTQPRVTFAKSSIPARNTRDLKRGDVVIVNDSYPRYKGELHIILKEMPNDGNKNVVGHIPENELILLDYLEPWKTFAFLS